MDPEKSANSGDKPPPTPSWSSFFWPIVIVAAAVTLALSVGVGRLIGAALLEKSLAQTQVMPTTVPTGSVAGASSGARVHAVAVPGEGREIFPSPGNSLTTAPPPPPSTPAARVISVGTASPSTPPATAAAAPAVKVIVSKPTPNPSVAESTPKPTVPPTPRPTFAPIYQITPAPLPNGG